jgi:hypothetical protein
MVQIHPGPPKHQRYHLWCTIDDTSRAGVAQLVERQLPKLNVAGSNPVSRSRKSLLRLLQGLFGIIADELKMLLSGIIFDASKMIPLMCSCSSGVEHSLGKGEVDGSIPSTSSKFIPMPAQRLAYFAELQQKIRSQEWQRAYLRGRSRMSMSER